MHHANFAVAWRQAPSPGPALGPSHSSPSTQLPSPSGPPLPPVCLPPALLCATHIPLRPTMLPLPVLAPACLAAFTPQDVCLTTVSTATPTPCPFFPLPPSTHLRTATPTPYPTFHSNAFACPPAPTRALAPPTLPPPALASTHPRPPMLCRPQLFSLLFPTFAANKSRPFARPGVASSDAPQCILCFFPASWPDGQNDSSECPKPSWR